MKHSISRIYKRLKRLNYQYKSLSKDFPHSSSLKHLYGSFLVDIGNNPDKGTSLIHRAEG